jgi:hypothetical protein
LTAGRLPTQLSVEGSRLAQGASTEATQPGSILNDVR